jgi:LuxR family maltose regulon positive regulatory protein
VAELSANDLRFDEPETAAVLQRSLGAAATDVETADFVARTEGWPAAVYLGALAAQAAPRPAEALAGFSGAARDVCDYLRLELLDAQPNDGLRSFLLETRCSAGATPRRGCGSSSATVPSSSRWRGESTSTGSCAP